MTAKKWTISFVIIILIILTGIAILNLVVDPYGYFDALDGQNKAMSDNSYIRVLKEKHIQKYGNNYDAFLLGGSKGGCYTAEMLKKLDGYNYYNSFITCGNFEEYYKYAKLIVEETNAKKIVLNLSGFECLFDVRSGVKQQTPAMLTGKSEIAEFISFLFKNPSLSIGEIFNPTNDYLQNDDGSRNLSSSYEKYYEDPQKYVEENCIYDLDKDLKEMFDNAETRTFSSFPNDIKYLRKIVELCKENDIELLVINTATPVTSRQSYEGEAYWNFLAQVATVTDYWDFTSYNDINLNPYNFYDDAHAFYEVIELIVDTINGTNSYEGFGKYITKDNVYEYLQERRTDFYKLKQEYEETGTITLQGYDDASNLLKKGE
jgi:hypothetical protein